MDDLSSAKEGWIKHHKNILLLLPYFFDNNIQAENYSCKSLWCPFKLNYITSPVGFTGTIFRTNKRLYSKFQLGKYMLLLLCHYST